MVIAGKKIHLYIEQKCLKYVRKLTLFTRKKIKLRRLNVPRIWKRVRNGAEDSFIPHQQLLSAERNTERSLHEASLSMNQTRKINAVHRSTQQGENV